MQMTSKNAFQVLWPAGSEGASQHLRHHCFHKTFRAAGPANFSGDGLRCTPLRRGAPLGCPTACRVACISRVGQAREGEGVVSGTFSRDTPSLYFLFIDSKRLSELNAPYLDTCTCSQWGQCLKQGTDMHPCMLWPTCLEICFCIAQVQMAHLFPSW